MSDPIKTIAFIIFGLSLAGVAYFVDRAAQPEPTESDALIGQPFFEEFESALDAASLRVSAVDADSAELESFRVENKDGLWRIPSHYNYPAEAVERLSNTATSVMGIIRETEAGAEKSRHPRFGVVDPESFDPTDEESYDLEGYGKRITLFDKNDEVLADFIIGKEVDVSTDDDIADNLLEKEGEKLYYIRRADENRTYAAKLNIDLSTRFEDWIKPDLLEVDTNKLTRIKIDKYQLRESQARIPGQIQPMTKSQLDQFSIVRPDAAGQWALDDFDESKETMVNSKLQEIVTVVDNLKIADVRPKTNFNGQPLVTAELEVNKIDELMKDPATFQRLMSQMQDEMESNGFTFANENGSLNLVSKFGEVAVGTEEGISYRLLFGDEFTAESREIEIQGTKSEDSEAPEPEADNESEEETPGQNRYMMVHVQFDQDLLPPLEPLGDAPVEPTKPEGYVPAKDAQTDEANKQGADNENQQDENKTNEAQSDANESQADDRDPKFVEYDLAMAKYQRQLTDHELNKTRFEEKVKARQEEIEKGRKRAAELNERFGLWYYVIKAENINMLLSARDDIVQPKAQESKPAAGEGRPDISFPPIPGLPDPNAEKATPDASDKKQPSPPVEDQTMKEKPAEEPGSNKAKADSEKADPAKPGEPESKADKSKTSDPDKAEPKEKVTDPKSEPAPGKDKKDAEPKSATPLEEKSKADSDPKQSESAPRKETESPSKKETDPGKNDPAKNDPAKNDPGKNDPGKGVD